MTIGVLVLVGAVVDVLSTVVAVSGRGGPLSGRMALATWRLLLRVHARRRIHVALRIGGVTLTIGTVLLWVALLLVGWTLVFVAGSVVDPATGAAAAAWERFYFVGYTIFTMGNGDLAAASSGWRAVTVVANAMGLILVTLAVTYLVPIVQAVVDKRSTASAIASLGMTTEEILRRAWNGSDLAALEDQLAELALPIDKLAQQHLAYPNLHYQHATDPRSALAPRLAAVDDAITVLIACDFGPSVIDRRRIEPLRQAIGNLLDTLEPVLDHPGRSTLPAPCHDELARLGLPVGDRASFDDRFEAESGRRRMLASLLFHDGWNWDSVHDRRQRTDSADSSG